MINRCFIYLISGHMSMMSRIILVETRVSVSTWTQTAHQNHHVHGNHGCRVFRKYLVEMHLGKEISEVILLQF